ncbi:hypothetical protein LP417_35050 (plasmid) [Polaromonas sp. P1-6]|nr:hypothetical protein LP417_35050 [Polaromonas sp. P1-6]
MLANDFTGNRVFVKTLAVRDSEEPENHRAAAEKVATSLGYTVFGSFDENDPAAKHVDIPSIPDLN